MLNVSHISVKILGELFDICQYQWILTSKLFSHSVDEVPKIDVTLAVEDVDEVNDSRHVRKHLIDGTIEGIDDIIKPSTNDKLFFSGQITITLLLGTSARTQEIFNRLMVTIDDSMYLTSDGRDDWNDGTSVVDDWLPD